MKEMKDAKIKDYEMWAIRGLLFACLIDIFRLRYPEHGTIYSVIVGLVTIGFVYLMMMLWEVVEEWFKTFFKRLRIYIWYNK